MSTHNLGFEQKYEKYQNFLSEIFHFLVVKFSIYLDRHVFVMLDCVVTQANANMCILHMQYGTFLPVIAQFC